MEEYVYKKVELAGVSQKSVSDATKNALERAHKTLRNLEWFEVSEIRGGFSQGKPNFQVVVKVGFRLEN